jgi:hypothetical protein
MRITINIETDTPPDCGVEYSWHVEGKGRGYHGKGRERDKRRALDFAIQSAHAYAALVAGET